jgi:hypothetical protein
MDTRPPDFSPHFRLHNDVAVLPSFPAEMMYMSFNYEALVLGMMLQGLSQIESDSFGIRTVSVLLG